MDFKVGFYARMGRGDGNRNCMYSLYELICFVFWARREGMYLTWSGLTTFCELLDLFIGCMRYMFWGYDSISCPRRKVISRFRG